jgi:Na+-transporting NADH:ubiquinone oxidoreductase subunit A
MSEVIKIKRGLNIPLKGAAEKIMVKAEMADTYAVKPIDFQGIRPKLVAKPGAKVKAGTPIFFDKFQPDVQFTSPVSGEVIDVVRGERRKILEVVVKADNQQKYEEFKKGDPTNMPKETIIEQLQKSGLWASIRQRPYNIIARATETPRDIFISAFDSAPLAPDMDFIMQDEKKLFQTGIDALAKLTDGTVHLGVNAAYPPAAAFAEAKGVQIHAFKGPHPAGNVGIQLNKIAPINKGEVVWTIKPHHVVAIGRLFEQGIYDVSKIVAVTGSEVKTPRYYKLIDGTSIAPLIKDNIKTTDKHRYISGNVLTGKRISSDGYLSFFDNQITVIPEGDEYEFLGWAAPGINKYSAGRTFLSAFLPKRRHRLNTNLHGGERAYVVTGEYEKVCPMDIYPQQLIKAIMIEDIDLMEQLGIYEVVEEDFALCEYVCTSKIEVQKILRQGLDLMHKEMS